MITHGRATSDNVSFDPQCGHHKLSSPASYLCCLVDFFEGGWAMKFGCVLSAWVKGAQKYKCIRSEEAENLLPESALLVLSFSSASGMKQIAFSGPFLISTTMNSYFSTGNLIRDCSATLWGLRCYF